MAGSNNAFVSGAGSVNVDLIFSGLPRIPEEGRELFAQGFSMQLGGGIPATLLNLGQLGVPVRIQTGLGEDLFSQFAREQFRSVGVEPFNLTPHTDEIPLNITAALLTPQDRTFVSYSDGLAVTDEMRQQLLDQSRGAKICAMDPRFPEVYEQLHREGTLLTLDTGWDDKLSIAHCRPLLELADYYIPNQQEAMKITGTASPEAAAHVLEDFFPQVVVKLDSAGCLICENGVQTVIPAIPEYVHRDSTGAGDAFLAGFLYGLYHSRPLAECVLFGNITGGKCVTAVGCLTALCTEEELLSTAQRYQDLLP